MEVHPKIYVNNEPIGIFFYYLEDAFRYIKNYFPNITDEKLGDMENGYPYYTEDGDKWEIRTE